MPTPSIQTLVTDAQQVLNLDSISAVRSVVAVALANANTGTPLNPNLTTQQLWNEFYQVVTKPKSDIESIIANQLMKFLFAPPAPGGVGANGQVIFNDNGVLAGDPQFLWNKTTNLLTVTGSATITGDLTAARLIVTGGTIPTNGLWLPTTNTLEFACNSLAQYRIAPLGVFSWYDGAGGTRMTLNSTGLGVGGSPVNPITAYAAASAKAPALLLTTAGSPTYGWDFSVDGAVNGNLFIRSLVAGTKTDVLEFDRATGNVGVGVTPSAYRLSIATPGELFGSYTKTVASLATEEVVFARCFSRNTNDAGTYNLGALSLVREDGAFGVRSSFKLVLKNGGGSGGQFEAARITSDGNLLVGTTSALASGSTFQNLGSARQVLTLKNDDSTSYTLGLWSATTTGDNFFAYFGTETTLTVRGAISYNRAGGLVAYNTTSDYRAKDIIGPVSNSGSLIDSLKVYIGKMKGATVERPMLIAHEAQSVAPYAVTGTKDEVDADGNPKYQQMDVSSFVPLLIAEIQSLRTRVAALES